MGVLALVEDRPTPKAVYNWRVYACAIVASCASCTIGYDSAFIGTTLSLPSFVDEFHFDTMSADHLALVKANIVSVYQAGAFFGSLFAYVSSYFWGRRISLRLFSLIFIVGAAMMLGANGDRGLGLIIGGRVLAGVGIGGASNMTPIYISELAPPAVRGRLVGIYEAGWQIGGLVGFWINYGLDVTMAPSHTQWLIPFAVQLIPAGLLLVGAFWIRESPRWLFQKGRREQAMANLCWIRNLPADDLYLVEEVAFIDAALEEQRATVGVGFWKPFQVRLDPDPFLTFFADSTSTPRLLDAHARCNGASSSAARSLCGKTVRVSMRSTIIRQLFSSPSVWTAPTRPSSPPASSALSRLSSLSSGSSSWSNRSAVVLC